MQIIDGHSHFYQTFAPTDNLKQTVADIEGFDTERLFAELDALDITQVQTMPQDMTRRRGSWLGSNALSADLQRVGDGRMIGYASGEPLDTSDSFHRTNLEAVEVAVREHGLQGLLMTPPYGHYYANDAKIYPFYEKAIELDIPIYFHHSHMFGPARECPLKYARVWLLDDVIIDFPELRFNVEHMGYPWTEELLSMMGRAENVFTDITMFTDPYVGVGRPRILARNLGMARDYGVLDRVFYGSDYVGESLEEYVVLLRRELSWLQEHLNEEMEKAGYEPLNEAEINGLLRENARRLWRGRR